MSVHNLPTKLHLEESGSDLVYTRPYKPYGMGIVLRVHTYCYPFIFLSQLSIYCVVYKYQVICFQCPVSWRYTVWSIGVQHPLTAAVAGENGWHVHEDECVSLLGVLRCQSCGQKWPRLDAVAYHLYLFSAASCLSPVTPKLTVLVFIPFFFYYV